ncbi:N-acetylmuramoyl-L-alanine amidase AmiC [termite gut metagenome]|uniref:N-acetylmuramoyl-L-alanine amidase AmiC n=1 Tax=termite gut metagenome TaxID=433724 RepID=A0A5J4QT98_9ZZZZ
MFSLYYHIMKLRNNGIRFILVCLTLFIFPFSNKNAYAKDFVVVIDPGHGGHDPGAIGKMSKEKNINLNVALKLGNLIKANCKDVKIVYTRNTDVFIPLNRRAESANSEKADLFISIHTNALAGRKLVQGASTWTLGLARSEENLEVAKRENAVMLYEADYQTRYAGFDPNSSESYIIFEFIQDKYMTQSVRLASLIQQQFGRACNRKDLGVRQAGFLVLKNTTMPSILVELGFISTPEEERFLNSETGASLMAKGIYNAFLTYKKENHVETPKTTIEIPKNDTQVEKEQTEIYSPSAPSTSLQPISSEKIIFKVQFLTSPQLLPKNHTKMKGLKEVEYYKDKGIYKYTYGASPDYNKVLNIKKQISVHFKDAFIVAFKNNKRIDIHQAIKEFKEKKN